MPSPTNHKGDIGQLKIVLDMIEKGYKISMPYSEGLRYDLIADMDGELSRVQCKYVSSANGRISVYLSSRGQGLYKVYTADEVDLIAVYDSTTDQVQYISPEQFGPSRTLYFESV